MSTKIEKAIASGFITVLRPSEKSKGYPRIVYAETNIWEGKTYQSVDAMGVVTDKPIPVYNVSKAEGLGKAIIAIKGMNLEQKFEQSVLYQPATFDPKKPFTLYFKEVRWIKAGQRAIPNYQISVGQTTRVVGNEQYA